MVRLGAFLLVTVALAACADGIQLTYSCSPAGAVVSPNIGICPTAVQYPVTPRDRNRGYIDIPGGNVIWMSGAYMEYPAQRLLFRNGDRQIIHFDRPGSFPGYEIDVRTGMERMQFREMNRQRQQRETERSLDNFTETLRALQPQPRPRTNCYSTVIDNSVITTCQ
jgi:hypothetical protein